MQPLSFKARNPVKGIPRKTYLQRGPFEIERWNHNQVPGEMATSFPWEPSTCEKLRVPPTCPYLNSTTSFVRKENLTLNLSWDNPAELSGNARPLAESDNLC